MFDQSFERSALCFSTLQLLRIANDFATQAETEFDNLQVIYSDTLREGFKDDAETLDMNWDIAQGLLRDRTKAISAHADRLREEIKDKRDQVRSSCKFLYKEDVVIRVWILI